VEQQPQKIHFDPLNVYGERRSIASMRKRVYEAFEGVCIFPDCSFARELPDGSPLLDIAHIDRWADSDTLNSFENFVLVCPNHHRMIDRLRSGYSTEDLRSLRTQHLESVASGTLRATPLPLPRQPAEALSRLQKALKIWQQERGNDSEEFWQGLFKSRPELLKLLAQGRPFVLDDKCYLGGKAVDNTGGSVIDFLAQGNSDAILIEIKTPTTRLLTGEYRAGVFPPSRELSGAVSQSLDYRYSLLVGLANLRMKSPRLTAHHPSIIVVAGDYELQCLSDDQKRSFALYRQSQKDVDLITYDELFVQLADMAVLVEPDDE
jgi:hypothetical protein